MRIDDVRLPQLSQESSEYDRRLWVALMDKFRAVDQRIAAIEQSLGLVNSQIGQYINPGYVELAEQTTAPAAPVANRVRIYAIDNGGKTELNARFNTGAIQQMEIEP